MQWPAGLCVHKRAFLPLRKLHQTFPYCSESEDLLGKGTKTKKKGDFFAPKNCACFSEKKSKQIKKNNPNNPAAIKSSSLLEWAPYPAERAESSGFRECWEWGCCRSSGWRWMRAAGWWNRSVRRMEEGSATRHRAGSKCAMRAHLGPTATAPYRSNLPREGQALIQRNYSICGVIKSCTASLRCFGAVYEFR